MKLQVRLLDGTTQSLNLSPDAHLCDSPEGLRIVDGTIIHMFYLNGVYSRFTEECSDCHVRMVPRLVPGKTYTTTFCSCCGRPQRLIPREDDVQPIDWDAFV